MERDEARVGARVQFEEWKEDPPITGVIAAGPDRYAAVLVDWDEEHGGHSTWTHVSQLRLLPDEAP